MDEISKAYEEYLKCTEKEITVGDDRYYKIIYKSEQVLFHKKSFIPVTLPASIFESNKFEKNSMLVEDENGNVFEIIGPEHLRFSQIPEWYVNTITVWIDASADGKKIGNYLRPIKQG